MPGLRCWISLSRHSSVVSRVPRPLTSIEPHSRTTSLLRNTAWISRALADCDMRLEISWSCFQLEYLAQALKRQVMAERWLASLSSFARPERPGAAVPTWPVAGRKGSTETRGQTRAGGPRGQAGGSRCAVFLLGGFLASPSAGGSSLQ